MRYLRVAVEQEPAVRHPMHQFVVERERYEVTRLLQFAPPTEAGLASFLFHVEGPVEPYESAMADVEVVREYEISPCQDESFYLYAREQLTDHGAEFVGTFARPELVGIMPIEYHGDGTVRMTAVGPAEALQAAVEEAPAGMSVDVLEVGEYDARRLDAGGDLTDRQFEAVAAAVDCGYYETPRAGTVADVGERLDCAPGTAAELLRRAERSVMEQVVSSGPF